MWTPLLQALAGFSAALPGPPDTVYFGGGTPSLLTPAQVERLLAAAAPRSGAEVTLEANPETVTPEQLRGYRAAGINRLSIGVQSARDSQLRTLGRPHTARQAAAAFEMARQAGFANLSGDIMLALPHYSRAEFDETLALIQAGGANHISAYLLKIEPGSAFGRRPPEGLPDADEAAGFYLYAVEQLAAAGYHQYEISSFARPGFEGRHNRIYWDCGDYLGIGPAAHSCLAGKRFYYPRRHRCLHRRDVPSVARRGLRRRRLPDPAAAAVHRAGPGRVPAPGRSRLYAPSAGLPRPLPAGRLPHPHPGPPHPHPTGHDRTKCHFGRIDLT